MRNDHVADPFRDLLNEFAAECVNGASGRLYLRPRFQLLAADPAGGAWTVHESNDPREVFGELEALQEQGRRITGSDYPHLSVWDDLTDGRVTDLEHALELLEAGGH
jgi:hypothetical protein